MDVIDNKIQRNYANVMKLELQKLSREIAYYKKQHREKFVEKSALIIEKIKWPTQDHHDFIHKEYANNNLFVQDL